MTTDRSGETRVALWICALVACVWLSFQAVAFWPWWPQRHGCGYETPAISQLRITYCAQEEFVDRVCVDQDGDGLGEYGTLAELSGGMDLRGTDERLGSPLVSGACRTVGPGGAVKRSGYRFRIFLVGRDGRALAEQGGGGVPADAVDPDGCEARWVCYAWPVVYEEDVSGRTFVVDHTGDIWATRDLDYTGVAGPAPGAAFPSGGIDAIGMAVGGAGQDGNEWRQVN